MGPWFRLEMCGKTRPPPGFVLPTVQAVASCRTYRAIPANDAESVADIMQHESLGKTFMNSCPVATVKVLRERDEETGEKNQL